MKRDPFAFMLVVALAFVCIMFLGGCASRPTIEEREAEALRTGDWSIVEKIERHQEGKVLYREFVEYCNALPGSYFLLCETRTGSLRSVEDIRRACTCATLARW